MRPAQWHTSPLPYGKTRQLADALGISEIFADVLARRGYDDPETASRYLDGTGELHDPFLFSGMEQACQRLKQAVDSGEKICIHGDYDVDGITATAVMLQVLRRLGGHASHYLPNRFTDGYGITAGTVEKIAAAGNTLLVTVDCGISCRAEIELARDLGLDTIVTDHHRPVEGSLPPGIVISPLICDYPFKELAGVGLAFKLAQALLGVEVMTSDDLPEELASCLDLVALGTIADVVPLVDENRTLVKRGLIQMMRGNRPGLKALMEISQVEPLKLSAGSVGYRLAPRINAAGRMESPEPALQLLMAEDGKTALETARQLSTLNQERQKIENGMLAQAQEIVSRWPERLQNANGYVISSPDWHEGIIGIVASRMVDLHQRPVILIAEGEEFGKGSGRSVPAFDLHGALLGMGHLLHAFGGHRAACGLTIETDLIDDFRHAFVEHTGKALSQADLLRRRYVDAMVTGRDMTVGLADELSRMEPFGLGNPQVDLLAAGVRLRGGRMTRDGMHLQCQVDAGGVKASAIGFRQGFLLDQLGSHPDWDVVFRLERNEFNGSVSPQLNLRELIPCSRNGHDCSASCVHGCTFECPDRIRGDEFWSLLAPGSRRPAHSLDQLTSAFEREFGHEPADLGDRLIDRRGYGNIPAQIGRLLATGQSLMLLVADVPRRRRLLSADLPLANLGIESVLIAGSRCGAEALDKLAGYVDGEAPSVLLCDFSTALESGLAEHFDHLVCVDPPPHQDLLSALAAASPQAWIHLFYCSDEVQFTSKVIEHEYSLRAPLTKVYSQLKTAEAHPLNEITERLLLSGGKYLRQPTMVVRCLKVLEELALISIEEKDGDPILTLPQSGKTDLEGSRTFRKAQAFYEGCQKFLNKSLKTTSS